MPDQQPKPGREPFVREIRVTALPKGTDREAPADIPPDVRFRQWLKNGLRRWGLRVEFIEDPRHRPGG